MSRLDGRQGPADNGGMDAVVVRAMPKRRCIAKWTGVVLCAVILGVWVASLWVYLFVNGHGWTFNCASGYAEVSYYEYEDDDDWSVRLDQDPVYPGANVGFASPEITWHAGENDTLELYAVWLPLWLPFAIASILTTILFYRDRKRIPPGHCTTCGYNLTGAEHERCPECGTACEAPGATT